MNTSVSLERDGDVAVILVDNPPVNALKHEVRVGIHAALSEAEGDASVKAVVLACRGRTFIAGADITEFGKPSLAPTLLDLIAFEDGMTKPVVAALHGTALGGGLELALGCHARIAVADARLGLPEVKLGLLPGAGGTQRLPRAVGPEKALRMILSGEPVSAQDALADGLIDAIARGDLLGEAKAFAQGMVSDKRPLSRLRDQDDKLAAARVDRAPFDALAADLTRRTRNLRSTQAILEMARHALDTPFDQAMERERALFMELLQGDQSKAQRHVFFAEREAGKVPDMPAGLKGRQVRRAAVIGAGTMGGGIAMCFANAGIPVTLIETAPENLERGLGIIEKNYRSTAARGGLTAAEVERRIGLIEGVVGIADGVRDADLVIEAVFEEMGLKKEIFSELDRLAKPGAVLATNTSTLDVDAIAAVTGRPQDVVGMHFFSPANVMRLLEVVRGKATAPDALATAMQVGRAIQKVPVVVGVCYGFVGNRMLHQRTAETERLLIEGALPQEVDGALTKFGFPMGPCAMGDLAGLDVGWRIRKGLGQRAEIADALCEAGRYGQKTGAGYFRYEGGRTPLPDPEVERLISETSARLGVARRAISEEEILERLLYPMINEGARILEEGIALRPGDIDVVWVYGYGWPAWRGGPMFHADQVGLGHIRDRLARYAEASGNPALEPAPLLARLAAEGAGFASLGSGRKAAA